MGQSYLLNAILYAAGNDVEPVVVWTNEMQSYAETLGKDGEPYVPVNFSSDPRHDAKNSYDGSQGGTSQWPSNLGLAATFNPETVLEWQVRLRGVPRHGSPECSEPANGFGL